MEPTEPVPHRILIVSRTAPRPYHGSSLHMEDFVRALQLGGAEVHYLTLAVARGADLTGSSVDRAYFAEPPRAVALPFDSPPQNWESAAAECACREVRPAIVIADYSWLGPIFDCPYFLEQAAVRRLIFVHDLRVRIMPSYVRMGIVRPEQNPWDDAREAAYLARAEILLTLNEQDQQKARELAPAAQVLRMGMSVSPVPAQDGAPISGRCVYVASAQNENLFAAMWLLKYAWPLVAAAHPSASLVICGGVGDLLKPLAAEGHEWLAGLEQLNVWLEGRVEDLAPYYASAQIALVPHWMDGGIKIKHIEALAHGLAVVCTPAGADGLTAALGRSAFAAEAPEEFAAHVTRLLGDPAALAAAREHARALAQSLTPETAYREVIDFLSETTVPA